MYVYILMSYSAFGGGGGGGFGGGSSSQLIAIQNSISSIQAAIGTIGSSTQSKDSVIEIKKVINGWLKIKKINVIIATGGTGLTKRDVTPEAFKFFFEKDIPGFGEIFRMISYKKIKTSTIQSRTCAGISKGKFLFSLPGSPGACKDAWDEIIKYQLDSSFKPCNLVTILPELQ